MTNIIKKSNKYYYQIIDGKKKRISKKKYLEMKKYKIGGTYVEKRDFIKNIYNFLIKNKIIRHENRLQNENIFFNETNDISNYQSIKPFLFYSHLFADSNIHPVYINKNETDILIGKHETKRDENYTNNLFKNYYEIYINFSTDKTISYKLKDGGGLFSSLSEKDLISDPIIKDDHIYVFKNELHRELTKNTNNTNDIYNIWRNVMGIFFPQKNFIIIPIEIHYEDKGGHQGVIIFDTINKKIYPFDPNDNTSDSTIYTLAIEFKNKMKIVDYEIVPANKICLSTTMGEDTPYDNNYFRYKCPLLEYDCGDGRGFCVQITFYYINFIVNNYDNPNNLNNQFLQSLVLDDTNTRQMKNDEFFNYVENKDIDINENINYIIFVYHMYQNFKILEWLNANQQDIKLLIDSDIEYPIYSSNPNSYNYYYN